MEIEFKSKDEIGKENASSLSRELSSSIISDCDVVVQEIKSQSSEARSTKSRPKGDLVTILSVATFTLAVIDTLINILTYWEPPQEYSVSCVIDGKTYSLKSNSLENLKNALSELEHDAKPKIEILIAKQ